MLMQTMTVWRGNLLNNDEKDNEMAQMGDASEDRW
jgi:hypothetical protein